LPYARRVAWLLADAARAARDDGQPRGPLTIGVAGDHRGAAPVASDRQLRRRLPRGRPGAASRHDSRTDRGSARPPPGGRLRLRPGRAPIADRTDDVRGGTVRPRRPRNRVVGAGDARRHRPHRRAARRLFISPAAGDVAGSPWHRGASADGVRHAGGDLRLCLGRAWDHLAAASVDRSGVAGGPGQFAPVLPPEESMVSTVFIHRREAHLSSALRAFLDHARGGTAPAEAIASGDTGDLIKPLPLVAQTS
jgi:hypothetical protein